jgi:glycosyltransferase involved in cell wall biosynthesis
MQKKISIVIPSRSEGQAIYDTIESLFENCKASQVDVVVVDDEMIPEIRNIKGVNVVRGQLPGFGNAIQIGINHAKHDNLFITGARTRFSPGFVEKTLAALKQNKQGISCGVSAVLRYDQTDITQAESYCYGARIIYNAYDVNSESSKFLLWLLNYPNKEPINHDPQCIYGGHYIITRQWWDHIRGLTGIKTRGGCNQFLSLKTIGAGGRLMLIDDMIIGNIYRERTSYPVVNAEVLYNRVMIMSVLGGMHVGQRVLASYQNRKEYKDINNLYSQFFGEIATERSNFLKIRKTRHLLTIKN